MNTSFELLSSMSPKINKNVKLPKKAPTKLALKKNFRTSLGIKNTYHRCNESIVTISSTTSSEEIRNLNETPIVISESEMSFSKEQTPPKKFNKNNTLEIDDQLTSLKEKYLNIQDWVENVNNAKTQDLSAFSNVSTIFGECNPGFRRPETNVAACSSLLDDNDRRFDECFKSKKKLDDSISEDEEIVGNSLLEGYKGSVDNSLSEDVINDSLVEDPVGHNFRNLAINDSEIRNKQPLEDTKIEGDQQENNKCENLGDYEDLLDSLYGGSWREKKEEVLPSSESKVKVKKTEVPKKVPNTERPVKKKTVNLGHNDNGSDNFLKVFQKARFKKALESPWVKTIKKLCDSDTESDSSEHILHPIKLNFEEDLDEAKTPEFNSDKKNTPPPAPVQTKKKKEKPQNKSTVIKNQIKKYSFLESLSLATPVDQSDYSALIFRNQFHQHKETLITRLFELYNDKVFDKKLPKDTNIEWNNRLRGTAGKCICKKVTRRTGAVERIAVIMLSKKVLDSADRLRDTLIHELCHAATWIINEVSDGHGARWKSWADKAMKVFPELPPIKRCHNYVINTKYSYICTGCSYTIGRHTKSLDVERKRCGYCYGTFEVLINKTTKKGETKSIPATPKKLNPFALFVKENYSSCKTPDLNHGDVMKILSQKFSDLKVQNSNNKDD